MRKPAPPNPREARSHRGRSCIAAGIGDLGQRQLRLVLQLAGPLYPKKAMQEAYNHGPDERIHLVFDLLPRSRFAMV